MTAAKKLKASDLGLTGKEYKELSAYEKAHLFILLEQVRNDARDKTLATLGKLVTKEEIALSIFFTWLWSKTHKGPVNEGDIILGIAGAYLIPPALRGGGWISEIAAAGYLSTIGINLFDPEWSGDTLKDSMTGPIPGVEWGQEHQQFRSECEAAGGRYDRIPTEQCAIPLIPATFPIGVPKFKYTTYKEWAACKVPGGTWDFLNKICTLPDK